VVWKEVELTIDSAGSVADVDARDSTIDEDTMRFFPDFGEDFMHCVIDGINGFFA
jgi:hypothetical protein